MTIGFILAGGFNWIDHLVRGFQFGPVSTGLFFFGILFFATDIIFIPFALYINFVIEEKFGFNKMTMKLFVLDKIKIYLVTVILGTPILGGILLLFETVGGYAWIYVWLFTTCVVLISQPLFTRVIAPLFNKFEHLEEGELSDAIENYAVSVDFPLKDLFVMDGSKRSGHSNAFFSGLIKKRITLYDTLIEKHQTGELVAIIAHEVGHYKNRHVPKGMVLSIVHAGILLFLVSLFLSSRGMFDAFRMDELSVYAGLVFITILYTPVEMLLSILLNFLSRRFELQADAYAAETTGSPEMLVLALKNLSVSNLSNLAPHPLDVFLNYSHPPVLERIRVLRSAQI